MAARDVREVWIEGSAGQSGRRERTMSTGRRTSKKKRQESHRAFRAHDQETTEGAWEGRHDEAARGDRESDACELVSEDEPDSPESTRAVAGREEDCATRYLHPLVRRIAIDDDDDSEGGQIRSRAILGPDGRSLVSEVDRFPFRAVCSLQVAKGGATQVGTGFLVAKNLVVTAGHNLCHNENLGTGYVDSVTVYVGRNGRNKYLNYEQIRDKTQLKVSRAWKNSKDPVFDWGVIVLNQDFGERYGAFSLGPWTDEELQGALFNVIGYPASASTKTRVPYQMWADAGEIAQVSAGTLRYLMDTSGGQSGAPLIAWQAPKSFVVGVHNYGRATYNQATRVTQDIAAAVLNLPGARFFEET